MSNNDEVPHVSRTTYLSRQNFRTRISCVPHSPKRPQCTRKAHLAAIHWVRCVQSGPPDLDRTLPGRSCNCSSRHLRRPSTVSIDDISRIHRTHLYKIPQTTRISHELVNKSCRFGWLDHQAQRSQENDCTSIAAAALSPNFWQFEHAADCDGLLQSHSCSLWKKCAWTVFPVIGLDVSTA